MPIIGTVPAFSAGNQTERAKIVSTDRISLLDARVELTRHLTRDERAELAGIGLPIVTVQPGSLGLGDLLAQHRAFGATVFEGVVVASLQLGGQAGIHLLGPGDLLAPGTDMWPAWLADIELRAAAPVKLALVGNEVLAAAYRWPRIVQGLYEAMGDQMRRLTAQLVICQLPRVEDRIMAMLWLLAESWGQVTPAGVRVPLALTHETLGALVGSRRPTVSLALRKLTEEGALVPQDSGWLLLGPAPEREEGGVPVGPVHIADFTPGRWAQAPAPATTQAPDPSIAYSELRETIRRLREQHQSDAEHMDAQLTRIRNERARLVDLRKRIEQDMIKRRRLPSS